MRTVPVQDPVYRDRVHDLKIFGLSGREGSGKSASAKIVCELYGAGSSNDLHPPGDPNVLQYCVRILFGCKVGDREYMDSVEVLKNLLRQHTCMAVLSRLDKPPRPVPKPWYEAKTSVYESAFANPLKLVCAQLFNVDYVILDGVSPETRALRENMTTEMTVGGVKGRTLRNVLEYMGTEVFRGYDQDFWIKAFKRGVDYIRNLPNSRVLIVPDVRFENELKAVLELGGVGYVIYREEKELVLTEEDKKQHVAKWGHLQYLDRLVRLPNVGSIGDLAKVWMELLR